jgi:hypothetical protein
MGYLPSPVDIAPLDAPLSVETRLLFDTGQPVTDRMAELIVNFANIKYDQMTTISVDVGVTEPDNDISTPQSTALIPVYKPSFVPEDVQVVAILLVCNFGEVALYFATDKTTEEYFNPPDTDAQIPLPLIPGGWFLHVDDHIYDTAANWQGETDTPVFVGEIMAASFLPSRITGYVFFRNRV